MDESDRKKERDRGGVPRVMLIRLLLLFSEFSFVMGDSTSWENVIKTTLQTKLICWLYILYYTKDSKVMVKKKLKSFWLYIITFS